MATAAQSEDGPPAPRSPVASQRSLSAAALLAGGPPPVPDDAKPGGLAAVVCASDYGNPPPPNSTHRSSRTSVERPGPAKVDGAAANDGGFQERKSSFSSARQDYDHPERQHHYCRQHGCCSPNAEPDVASLEQGNFVSSVPEIAMPEFPRSHNTPQEIVAILEGLGHKKCSTKILKTFLLSIMAGFWITLAGILATSLAGGFPVDVRARWPVLPRLLTAAVFPVGLIFEVLFGGELFTGNTMILFVSWLSGRITKRALAVNWTTVWLGNLAGSLLTLVLFAWLPGLFENEPFRAFAIAGAEVRGSLSYEIVFLRSVPANVLVCLSIYLGLMARDVVGKAFGMYVPIFVFVATTMEHCIADMYFVPMGMLLGANVGFDSCVVFLIVCTVGNVVGGALLVGGSLWYMHGAEMTGSAVRKKFEEK